MAKWAIDEINSNGRIDGRPIQMISYDAKGDVNEAINAYTRAVTVDNVSAIIGRPIANICLALAPISEQYDVPIIDIAVDPKCHAREPGDPYKNMFGIQPSALSQGAIMAKYAMKNGYNTFDVMLTPAFSAGARAPSGSLWCSLAV